MFFGSQAQTGHAAVEFDTHCLYTGFVRIGRIGGGKIKVNRRLFFALGISLAIIALSWVYTITQLNFARSKGVYATAEQGMLAFADKYYTADRNLKILSAGPNSIKGSQPHFWYVIAEVHATSRADSSELKHNGCDAPGLAFLQTKEGWVYVPDGAFPGFIGFWMRVFNMAGEGQSTPSTDLLPDQPTRLCNSDESIWYGR